MHDTFAKEGRKALPNIPYLAPDGFVEATEVQTEPLLPPPREWDGEIDVLRIDGVRMNEHALFHRRSRTLVVADLFFSFPQETSGWPRFFVRHVMRLPRLFGISALYRSTRNPRQGSVCSFHARTARIRFRTTRGGSLAADRNGCEKYSGAGTA